MKRNTAPILILFLVAVVFGGTGSYMFLQNYQLYKIAEKTNGIIVGHAKKKGSKKNRTTYAPIVKFNDHLGKEYTFTSKMSSSSGSFRVGEVIELIYDPQKPENANINTFFQLWGFPFIFIGSGFLLLISFLTIVRQIQLRKYLQADGKVIQAKVREIGLRRMVKNNRRHPYQIIATWHDQATNTVYTFKSDDIWDYDPSEYIKKGDLVDVLVMKTNFKKYWMNLEKKLPRAA